MGTPLRASELQQTLHRLVFKLQGTSKWPFAGGQTLASEVQYVEKRFLHYAGFLLYHKIKSAYSYHPNILLSDIINCCMPKY